ncbi:hypothetical protein FACS1894132_12700 [Clostridia bacterium]|nr:hypothetical protein FACS1894132_12700 [Clostridia bacterium]
MLKNDFNIDDEKALEIFEKAEEQNPIEEQILTENERNSDIDTPEIPTPETPDLDDFGDDFELE